MKTIRVKNITIQFNTDDEGADKHNALDMLDAINETLENMYPLTSPQIFTQGVDESDVDILEYETEEN